MKKLDKLILKTFWGPFVITLSVVVFIFLMRVVVSYIDEFMGKGVEFSEYVRLFSFFALSVVPTALPLAMLLSSLMAFGNLGEFFELTALKSAGVSMTRIMRPLFFVAILISVFSFFFNDRVVPWANLKAFSLLYDIKTSKATLNIKEGIFYNDLPGYSIKVDKKLPNGTMLGMIIYKHEQGAYDAGNKQIILADSGRMFTIDENNALVIELFSGNNYQEMGSSNGERSPTYLASTSGTSDRSSNFMRNRFDRYKTVVSMESFGLKRTDEDMFKYHEFMKNISDLNHTSDSLQQDLTRTRENLIPNSQQYFVYEYKNISGYNFKPSESAWVRKRLKKPVSDSLKTIILSNARANAANVASFANSNATYLDNKKKEANRYQLEMLHKFTQAVSCFVMFLIGAPLGAIIKKGGFGVPVLVSIIFFILLYVLTVQGDKYVKDGLLNVVVGAWLANFILFWIGVYFVDRARSDSRIFEMDVYQMYWRKLKARMGKSPVQAVEGA